MKDADINRSFSNTGGKLSMNLLDYLTERAGQECISDLKWLIKRRPLWLAYELEDIPAESVELRQWNDALEYLTGHPPEQTAEAAKKRLVAILSPLSNEGKKPKAEKDKE